MSSRSDTALAGHATSSHSSLSEPSLDSSSARSRKFCSGSTARPGEPSSCDGTRWEPNARVLWVSWFVLVPRECLLS